jgi:RNA polymerase sigma factor (TIGR02999 family)
MSGGTTYNASAGDLTGLLLQWNQGDPEARERLIPLVYKDLRSLAGRALKSEGRDQTLQPTALVHETYQKLIDQRRVRWQNRAHFFAVAATLMRRILVDHARRRAAFRRAQDARKLLITDTAAGGAGGPNVDLIALDEALTELGAFDPRQARIVELRYFAGLGLAETAEAVGVSRATVKREWVIARAWLRDRLAT